MVLQNLRQLGGGHLGVLKRATDAVEGIVVWDKHGNIAEAVNAGGQVGAAEGASGGGQVQVRKGAGVVDGKC